MLKFKGGRVALCLFILSCAALFFGVVHQTKADNSFPWLTAPLYLNKVKDVAASDIPSSFFGGGNIDCIVVYDGKCSIDTPYGSVWGSSVWLDGKWRPIKDYGGNSSNFFAIPNSDIAFTTSSPSGFGSYLYFTDDTSNALSPNYLIGPRDLGAGLTYFQLNRQYDRKLADKDGNRLVADLNSMAFSGNSEWMVVTDPNIANLRVNLNTGEVLLFGKAFTYGSGQNPVPKNAITSDGRYALEAAKDTSSFTIYDLSTCESPPDAISKPVNCLGRELLNSGYLPSQIPGYNGTINARFLNNETLSFYASYKEGSITKYALYTLSANPGTANRLQYLALGDSYISGEGAFDYQAGTDTDTNYCHTSLVSYPYLLGRDLNYDSYHSVACSGAVTANITDKSLDYAGNDVDHVQAKGKNTSQYDDEIYSQFLPGYRAQINFVEKNQPKAITISIGGNDMGFSKILTRCLEPDTCYNSYEDRVELVRQINDVVFPRLLDTYQKLKNASPGTMTYVIGYPQIINPDGSCGDNVHLSGPEGAFAELLIDYLDQVIEAAANNSGVRYVDVQHALDGHRLCEAKPGSIAMNGITAGNDRILNTVGAESYHPNAYGYALLEQAIMGATDNLTQPMPTPDPASTYPSENELAILDAPKSNRDINLLNYDDNLSNNVVYRHGVWSVTVKVGKGIGHPVLKAFSKVKAVLNSDPIDLGDFTTDQHGNLEAGITDTDNVPSGFHTLHIYGEDEANEPVDIYKVIYVADSPDSLKPTVDNPCVVVPPSGHDADQDGVDDACDGEIGMPPTKQQTEAQAIETAPVNKTVATSTNKKSADGSVEISVADPQTQTLHDDIDTAGSDKGKPAVLAAEVSSKTASPGNSSENEQNNVSGYLITGGAILALGSVVYMVKRWL